MNIPLHWYLILAAALFCIGLYGVLARRNAVTILMSIELMLNAVNINLVAFARYVHPAKGMLLAGQAFSIFVMTIAAAETAIGLAIILAVYRNLKHINVEEVDVMRW
jgi:NADH:ubiquinone oxidoreductase subunit K